ncbi:heat-inducible transcriptional repressor HrcA [Paenibacillus sp. TRM 82003]|uniref:heat-inducible transcriptional repressor HrcA n=1 Tax=Kineococcus sp. TRM81007 TaxID=2925831 RepID=UPI001F575AF6|nr:heat-inducible transcriptional repressor HrcA [Kineococcus sp. TRM81007]MCI2240096.1 heat-inducible transcriptional repressor HrcA [Kineococcus sp. TRM81007]MCI3925598.1 heat-inducible transcriptional repressor HrcA [Paenibacillus sp. TRM 82003]
MSDDRRLAVLRAIVEDYVSTHEPVGSRALVERHRLGVSPATIRNDMAVLEEEGYIAQPHTSAGRIPTDKGYRLFVDRLANLKPMSPAERRAIQAFLDGAVDLDDVVDRTVRLLAQITRQAAVVQYPSLSRAAVRHVEVVPVGGRSALLVLITDTGRVEQRVVQVRSAGDLDALPEQLAALRDRVNAAVAGKRLKQAREELTAVVQASEPGQTAVAAEVVAALGECLTAGLEERVVIAGTANLVRSGADLSASLGSVLEALEEHVVLLRLVQEMAEEGVTDRGALSVRIGAENLHLGLPETSVVTSGYGEGEVLARLGVLGPTRMDYPTTMAAVRAVSRYVSRILSQ